MEPTAIAATAAVVSAAAAWGALASSAHRAKKDWQRDTTLRSAVHVLQLCQRRHNREHELFDDKELTVDEVDVAYSELHAITDEVERELISVRLIADRNVVDAMDAVYNLMIELDFHVTDFRRDLWRLSKPSPLAPIEETPRRPYVGAMFCLSSLLNGTTVDRRLSDAVDVYVTSWWQRMDRRARAWQAKLLLG
ncbi:MULTISPECIES: hypothetical protein [Gordonia]|uniref:Uncharacterized protein n=2 Tax=Gordonia TaxID=2053 RepID=A0A9X3D7G6_9ACTN|nr:MULTISPECIES: hypothetical protein [Gordonia]MCF3937072.1 hypothetical protein [Gordonia tangerina]MCX2966575.1 hypothetical protein [Gordonia aquimaris]